MSEDIKEIETNPTPWLVRAEGVVWRCGDLGTGAIAVGLTTLVTSVLLPAYYVETELRDRSFSFQIVVVLLVSLFLAISDCALIFGATKRHTWLLVPWIGIHALFEVFLLFYLTFKYHDLSGSRTVMLLSFFIMLYFVAVVVLFYLRLKRLEKEQVLNESAVAEPQVLEMPVVSNASSGDGVDGGTMSRRSLNPFLNEDTFTEIAERSGDQSTTTNRGNLYVSLIGSPENPTLDDSGEFAVPASANDRDRTSFQFPLSDSFLNGSDKLLPTPDEVIQLKKESTVSNSDVTDRPFAGDFGSQAKSSSNLKGAFNGGDCEPSSLLLPAKSEPQISRPKPNCGDLKSKKEFETVNMDLVDAFTPFKKKPKAPNDSVDATNASDEQSLPKMKIFLPKAADDDGSEASSISSNELAL